MLLKTVQACQAQCQYCDLVKVRDQVVDTPEVVIKYILADADCCLRVKYLDTDVVKFDIVFLKVPNSPEQASQMFKFDIADQI
jgi:hypothetical protein